MQDPHVLINAYIDDAIDDEGFEQLCDWLRASPANRIAFAKATSDHAAIAEWAGERSGGALTPELSALDETQFERSEWIKLLSALDSKPGQAELVELVDLTEPFSLKRIFENRSALAWTSSALVAASVLLGVLLVITLSGPSTTPNASPIAERNPATTPTPKLETKPETKPAQPVATLTATHNAQWAQAEGASAPGSHVRPGDALAAGQRLNLTHGFAEITTNRGAVAILEAPATIELLDNANALRLHTGKLVGICATDSSKGFLVRTPHMDVTDLGTEFGVEVTDEQTTTTVFTGSIQVTSPGGPPQKLITNQTAKLTVHGNNRELVVDQQIATGFEALRNQRPPLAAQLPATGVGLSPGEYCPDWRVTALDGQLLDSPLPMLISRDAKPVADDDPLAPSQMLLRSLRDHGGSNTLFQMETTLRLPAGFDPAAEQLAMRFRVDNVFKSLRINGQAIQVPAEQHTAKGNYYAVTIQAPLRSGDNQITFEIINEGENDIYNPAGVQVAWELEPVPTQKP